MTERILHVSDFHLGRREASEPISALRELVARLAPELVIATGDLAHRGTRSQLERGAEQLRSLETPVLAVPGNHDIPYTFPARFTRTFADWNHVFGEPEPVYRSETIVAVGLNSVHPWRQQGGALREAQLDRVAAELRHAPESALRVVALHHHLAAPPWRTGHKRPLRRRDAALQALVEAGAELVVSGHVHQAGIVERREFEVVEDGHGSSVVLTTTPGFGRPRPRRKGEAQGLNVYAADTDSLIVTTFAWDGSGFAEVGLRTFPRR